MADSFKFSSRRSVVVCKNGCVASSNPLASQAGLDILKAGGNAADAAVAVAAALNVTEPMSTGLGGDAFCMFYEKSTKTVKGLNGSGRCPQGLSLERLSSEGFDKSQSLPPRHAHCVTVPGAASVWVDAVDQFGSGKVSLADILKPAIDMAETGFPVQEIVAFLWAEDVELLQGAGNLYGKDLLLNGKPPQHSDVMRNPHLATVFKELVEKGKAGFYTGRVAEAVSEVVQTHGGVLSLQDMAAHTSTSVESICTDYRGCRLWELPPNGQGMTALMALNILEGFDLKSMGHNSALYLHHVAESLHLAFADTLQYCTDPEHMDIPLERMLSKDYAAQRRALIQAYRALPNSALETGGLDMPAGTDTVYFTTADSDGNACSFINSTYMSFGTGLVPEGCGFTLQNRGHGFSLDPTHRNALAPGKRPYHTIIPAMVTSPDTNDLLLSFGVMGGFMQPQGHVQILLNMLEFGLDPQAALDAPRICLSQFTSNPYAPITIMNTINLEEGIPTSVLHELKALGHQVELVTGHKRFLFGRGQTISRGSAWWSQTGKPQTNDSQTSSSENTKSQFSKSQTSPVAATDSELTAFSADWEDSGADVVYWAGSDPRADGLVAAY